MIALSLRNINSSNFKKLMFGLGAVCILHVNVLCNRQFDPVQRPKRCYLKQCDNHIKLGNNGISLLFKWRKKTSSRQKELKVVA